MLTLNIFTTAAIVFIVTVASATDYDGYCPPQCACFKFTDQTNITVYPPKNVWVSCEQPNPQFTGYKALPKIVPNDTYALDLSFNQIKHLQLTDTLPTLKFLKLSTNTLQIVDEDAFDNLYNLETLFLSYNNLSELHPLTLKALVNLTNLDLSNNRLASLPKDIFNENSKLTELILSHNPLLNLYPEWFTPLKELTKLDLSETKLYSIRPETFHMNRNLRSLDLSGNLLADVPNEALTSVANSLQILKLNVNRLKTLNDNSFRHLTNLVELEICGNELLISIGSRTFSELTSLRNLTVAENDALSYIHPSAFNRMYSVNHLALKTLSLRNNHLTNLTVESLPFCLLDKLDLRSNPWHCDCNLQWVQSCESVEGDPRCATPHQFKTLAIPAMAKDDFVCAAAENKSPSRSQLSHSSPDGVGDLKVAKVLILLMAGTLLLVLGVSIVIVLKRSDFIQSNVRRGNGSIYYVKAQSTPTGYLNDVPTGSLI